MAENCAGKCQPCPLAAEVTSCCVLWGQGALLAGTSLCFKWLFSDV